MNEWIEQSWDFFHGYWPLLLTVFGFVFETACALHAILYKRDTRHNHLDGLDLADTDFRCGALRAVRCESDSTACKTSAWSTVVFQIGFATCALKFTELSEKIGRDYGYFEPLAKLIDTLAEQPLLAGNQIDPLMDGDQAYPKMLEAIGNARISITLCTYIFDNDPVGRMFSDALSAAKNRGVDVRILIDDVGSRYTFPSIVYRLRRAGIRVERFMRNVLPTRFAYSNLRSHRKILVVDGRIGFTGGMNIRQGTWHEKCTRSLLHDLHFQCRGPIVAQLQESFAEDWAFTTNEVLEGEKMVSHDSIRWAKSRTWRSLLDRTRILASSVRL